jgi:hypothetical protein
LDENAGVTGWTLHDLRRTARSLMSRAGVPSDHAERCLGHVLPGVRGVYDRHAYHAEKQRTFEALAAQIERIVNPQDNVVPLRDTRLPPADHGEPAQAKPQNERDNSAALRIIDPLDPAIQRLKNLSNEERNTLMRALFARFKAPTATSSKPPVKRPSKN